MKALLPFLLLLMVACKKDPDSRPLDDTGDTGEETDTEDTEPEPIVDGPSGFIGGPCATDTDCDYDGGVCLTTGFPRGTCSMACDKVCPDESGFPTTFCVPTADLPPIAADKLGSEGACLSRCDLGEFDTTEGCRTDYGCVVAERNNEPATLKYACLPDEESELAQCHSDLAALGVDFEPTIIADAHPSGFPNLTCHVEDAVVLHPPMHGVDLVYYDGTPTSNITMSCEGALSLSDTVLDVEALGVETVRHYGTYVCRVISGTSELSRHGFGDAIDIYGFDFENGDRYTLIDDWEHNTTNPSTAAGQWLYDAAYRWYDANYWAIILTPNYNTAHDNHFHVDLTPGGDFIRSMHGARYIGPAPYGD